ncbi:MAG TPA: hypothetical protein VFL97_01440 [Nitrococcus sp.]|nr:hypothetical protein [Nitrococcus sp.]
MENLKAGLYSRFSIKRVTPELIEAPRIAVDKASGAKTAFIRVTAARGLNTSGEMAAHIYNWLFINTYFSR